MSDNTLDELNKSLYTHIEANQHRYPLMARSWNITVTKDTDVKQPTVLISKFNARLERSYPFYKPYSRVIDISILK